LPPIEELYPDRAAVLRPRNFQQALPSLLKQTTKRIATSPISQIESCRQSPMRSIYLAHATMFTCMTATHSFILFLEQSNGYECNVIRTLLLTVSALTNSTI
jgi:hypothetical protein